MQKVVQRNGSFSPTPEPPVSLLLSPETNKRLLLSSWMTTWRSSMFLMNLHICLLFSRYDRLGVIHTAVRLALVLHYLSRLSESVQREHPCSFQSSPAPHHSMQASIIGVTSFKCTEGRLCSSHSLVIQSDAAVNSLAHTALSGLSPRAPEGHYSWVQGRAFIRHLQRPADTETHNVQYTPETLTGAPTKQLQVPL